MKKINDKSKMQMDNFPDKLSNGVQTQKLLDSKKVVSPSTKDAIMIKPGTWVVPKKKINTNKELNTFINDKLKKYKLGKYA
jgi:hypothetical protein